ncbi:uncharacterized protein LOC126150272 [Schistocerca cancellata]|uniref:uncharacterized protein LOC126150272 n=1 Tax=Schistocerca cancellata TaxID=274614 RepID=UPI0021191B6C|nr:uncharacterized protein LOC126150272 [Schistocerca cancellata]
MSSESKPWRRPDDKPVPTVWRRFEGRRPMADGRKPRFVIQDVPPELDDAVLEHMVTHFLRDEPVCSLSGLRDEPDSLRCFTAIWRDYLRQRAVLVALVEDDDGVARRVAGANLTKPECLADKDKKEQVEGVASHKVFDAYAYVMSRVQPDVFTRYGVDCYLTALGLSVDPEFRGQGVGEQLLRARWDLCRALGIPLTVTWFTARASQILAERVGFETLVEVSYEEYGEPDFKKSATPTMKIMAARIT